MAELPPPPAYPAGENEGQPLASAPYPAQPMDNKSGIPVAGGVTATAPASTGFAANQPSAPAAMQPLGQTDNFQINTNHKTYYMKKYDNYPESTTTFLQLIGISPMDPNAPPIVINADIFDQTQTKLINLNLFKNHQMIKFSANDTSGNLLAELKNSSVSRLGLARSFYNDSVLSLTSSKYNIENNLNQIVASFGISRHPAGFEQPNQHAYQRARNNNRRPPQPRQLYQYRFNIYDPTGKIAFYLEANELYEYLKSGRIDGQAGFPSGAKTFYLYKEGTSISFKPEAVGRCVLYTNRTGSFPAYYHESDLTKSVEITMDSRHINSDNERNLVFLLCYINDLFFTERAPLNGKITGSIAGVVVVGVAIMIIVSIVSTFLFGSVF